MKHGERSIALALSSLATAAAVHAQDVYYVDASAAPGGNGETWQQAYRDLQDAIDFIRVRYNNANGGAAIHLAQGVYLPDRGTLNRDLAFSMTSGLTLMGGFAGLLGTDPDERDPARFVSVLSGNLRSNDGPDFTNREDNSNTIVDSTGASWATLDGLVIRGENTTRPTPPFGAVGGEDLTILRKCSVTDNFSRHVGVLARSLLLDSIVANNRAENASILAAEWVYADHTRIAGNMVSSNSASQAVAYGSPYLGLFRTVVDANICIGNTALLRSDGQPGLFDNPYFQTTISNCTIINNRISQALLLIAGKSHAQLWNLICTDNDPLPGNLPLPQLLATDQSVLDADGSTIVLRGNGPPVTLQGNATLTHPTAFLTFDPRLLAPAGADADPLTWEDNLYTLRADSPCIDAGKPDPGSTASPCALGLDDPRVPNAFPGSAIDIGAFERDPRLCPADFNADQHVDARDIFAFLDAWQNRCPTAAYLGRYMVGPDDLFEFIRVWIAGCP